MYNLIDAYHNYRTIVEGINEGRTNIKDKKQCVALYVSGNRVVSIGLNKSKTHPLLLKFKYDTCYYYCEDNSVKNHQIQYPIHAELDGYIKILNQSINFDKLFIYRGPHGTLASKPCHICSAWISKIHKLKVIYTNQKGVVECVRTADLKGHYRRNNAGNFGCNLIGNGGSGSVYQ